MARFYIYRHILGVCVGPSMLWESAQNAPLRTLPTLIEMLISNCQVLFGSQVVSLLGEVANDSGAEESDSLHCKYKVRKYEPKLIKTCFSLRSIIGLSGIEQRSEIPQSRFGFDSVGRRPRKSRPQLPHGHFPSFRLGATSSQNKINGQFQLLDRRR